MRRRLALLPLLLAWLLATGSQWDLVQTFAWGKMIATYSRTMPLADAVRLTFAPDNLCGLCKVVSSAKREQPASSVPGAPAETLAKIPLVFQPAPLFVAAVPVVTDRLSGDLPELQGAARAAPPVPPPRGQA